jgi:hypothetical protein
MSRSSIYYTVLQASGVGKLQILIAADKVVQKAYLSGKGKYTDL